MGRMDALLPTANAGHDGRRQWFLQRVGHRVAHLLPVALPLLLHAVWTMHNVLLDSLDVVEDAVIEG